MNGRKNKSSLNSSASSVSGMDLYIDKYLSYSYKFMAPFFEDEEFEKSFKEERVSDNIDEGFDGVLPSWIKLIIDFLLNLYRFIFPEKLQKKLHQSATSVRRKVARRQSHRKVNTFKKGHNPTLKIVDS